MKMNIEIGPCMPSQCKEERISPIINALYIGFLSSVYLSVMALLSRYGEIKQCNMNKVFMHILIFEPHQCHNIRTKTKRKLFHKESYTFKIKSG